MPVPTKSQRWLDLIALLLGRTIPLTVEEIMERVPAYAVKWKTGDPTQQATARRTFERDKDDLRRAGIPLEPIRYSINYAAEQLEGYRLSHGDFYLPYLKLISREDGPRTTPPPSQPTSDPSAPLPPALRPYAGLRSFDLSSAEAELALEALRRVAELPAFPFVDDARSALRKLSFDIDPDRFPVGPVLWVDRPGSREVLDRLRTLSDALLARKRVTFVYHGIHRGRTTAREVEPYGLFFQRDWYLVARDAAADGLRVFRVSRMEQIEPNKRAPKSADFVIPHDFALGDYLDRSAWELGDGDETMLAQVRFRFPLSLQAARSGEGELVREEDGGSAVRSFRVSQPNPFLRWILSLGGDAEIVSPPELRQAFDQMVSEVAALYETDHKEVLSHG